MRVYIDQHDPGVLYREVAEYADGAATIDAEVIADFHLKRAWLDPAALPRIHDALAVLDR